MQNPLSLLTLQTFNNPINSDFTRNDIDYDAVVVPPPFKPGQFVEPVTVNQAQPPAANPTASVYPTSNLVPDVQPIRNDRDPAIASSESAQQDNLYLAEACGNCARSYGTPLACSYWKIAVSILDACENFYSPFDIS